METVMTWLSNNWFSLFCLIALLGWMVILNKKMKDGIDPNEEDINKFREWLLFAVMEAEKELGSGTGQLKLRYVYDKARSKYPFITNFISFEMFSEYVDEALDKFKAMLKSNKYVQDYVGA